MDAFQALLKLILDEKSLKQIQSQINNAKFNAKIDINSNDINKLASDLSRLSQAKTMQTWADNNSKAMKIWGNQINDIATKIGSLDKDMSKADFQKYVNEFKSIQNEAVKTGNVEKALGENTKSAFEKLTGSNLASKSLEFLWNQFKEFVPLVKELDNAISDVAQTSKGTESQLGSIGVVALGITKVLANKNFGRPEMFGLKSLNVLKLPNIISVLSDTKVFLWSAVRYTVVNAR